MKELSFLDEHWGDVVGLFLVVVGLLASFLTAWKFPQNVQMFTLAAGIVASGFVALKLQKKVPSENDTDDDTTQSVTQKTVTVATSEKEVPRKDKDPGV